MTYGSIEWEPIHDFSSRRPLEQRSGLSDYEKLDQLRQSEERRLDLGAHATFTAVGHVSDFGFDDRAERRTPALKRYEDGSNEQDMDQPHERNGFGD